MVESQSMPPSLAVSVVICSHNPRLDYLERTLVGLRAQTLPLAQWELIIIDNASAEPLAPRIPTAWHPLARNVVESSLGLTNARLRGIAETKAPLLVFVDDDNVLAPDYLATALEIGCTHPFLGAWGGGINGIYEIAPPDFCRRHAHMLAIRDVPRDLWSNTTEDFLAAPCGAGMCIRRNVAAAWSEDVRKRPAALKLGRIGNNLGACEDGHLALLSVSLGLGTGVFRRLTLDHLIPRERLTLEYFTRLAAGHAYSYNLLRHLQGKPLIQDEQSGFERLIARIRRWRAKPAERAIAEAMSRARNESVRDLNAAGE